MNKTQRNNLAEKLRSKRDKNVKILEDKIRQCYKKLENSQKLVKADYDFIYDWEEFQADLTKTLTTNMKNMIYSQIRLFENFYNLGAVEIKFEKVYKKVEKEYSKDIGKKVKNITETDRERIEKLIAVSKENGNSYKTTEELLSKEFDTMSESRSKMIAVTETNTLSSEIDNAVAEDVGMNKKTWIHVGAGKTDRENHLRLDNVTIGIDNKFNLGNGIEALYPHDPTLPAGEVINCYCMCVYE